MLEAIYFFIIIFLLFLLLPSFWRIALTVWASIFQIYTLPLFGFYPSVALVSHFALAPILLKRRRALLQWPIIFMIAFIIMQSISLLWALDLHLGLATILYELPFIFLYIVAFELALNNPNYMIKIIKIYAILSIVPLIFIISFSLNHDLNIIYLKSVLAKKIINPNTLDWYFRLPGHELSLIKPGKEQWLGKPRGFFINPNVGGAYMGICAFFIFGVGIYARSLLLKIIGLLHWLTLFLTFSFAAILLGLIIPFVIISIYLLTEKEDVFNIANKKLLNFIYSGAVIAAELLLIFNPGIIDKFFFKLESRMILWKIAKYFSTDHLLWGLGFGKWFILYEEYRQQHFNEFLSIKLPPHNTLVKIWSESGLVAAILVLLFMFSTLYFCYKAFKVLTQRRERLFVLFITSGIAWIFLQGMGENWGITGEMHIQPIFAMAFGLLSGIYYHRASQNLTK